MNNLPRYPAAGAQCTVTSKRAIAEVHQCGFDSRPRVHAHPQQAGAQSRVWRRQRVRAQRLCRLDVATEFLSPPHARAGAHREPIRCAGLHPHEVYVSRASACSSAGGALL